MTRKKEDQALAPVHFSTPFIWAFGICVLRETERSQKIQPFFARWGRDFPRFRYSSLEGHFCLTGGTVKIRIQATGGAIEWSENDNEDWELPGLTLAAVAGNMGVHRMTVSRRLRRETGLTWREQKSRRTEVKAEQLLSDPRLSVKEVAFILKFSSTSAFSRFFQRRTGVSPSAWRCKMSTEKN